MKNTTRIGIVLVISFAFFIAEIAGETSSVRLRVHRHTGSSVGFRTKSLALIADAFHYLNDIVAYAIAFIAAYLQDSGEHTVKFTFAFHRAELVGAFFNGVFLLALALSIFLQSIERFLHVEAIEEPFLVLIIGCVGLTLNIISAFVIHDHHGHGGHGHGQSIPITTSDPNPTGDSLREHIHATHNHTIDPPVTAHQHNLGLVGVLVHLIGDAVNNIGVIIVALIIWKAAPHSQNRFYADPAASLAISLIIFASAIPMTLKSGRILLEAAPLYLDLAKIKEDLLSIPDVLSVHDLHVWHLSQSYVRTVLRMHAYLTPLFMILLSFQLPLNGRSEWFHHVHLHHRLIITSYANIQSMIKHYHLNERRKLGNRMVRVILASLHACVPTGTSLEQWEQIEQTLQHCFQAYGISHVTISPELQRSEVQSLNDFQLVPTGGCSRLPSHDDYGCAVSELKKRRLTGGV
ncbi:hypothetical protein D9756_002327 [Leucocoprinus leucothites]|uniref:Uncharacterized protein n=1 Tax=Leucocoprinus leucothites TaxID=201217 RepID=A0A8H5LM82_9AGAR|nr:hypothetical protein D9756_002327 [Leucoagaricus leucothites]